MEYVAIGATILGLVLTVLNIYDKVITNRQRVLQQGARTQSAENDIEVIRQGNASILLKLDKMDGKMDDINERLIRVEESTKSAHHRIDGLEGRHD